MLEQKFKSKQPDNQSEKSNPIVTFVEEKKESLEESKEKISLEEVKKRSRTIKVRYWFKK